MCPKNGTSTNCYYSQTGLRFSGILSSSSRIFHRQQMFSPKLAFPIMNNGWKMILSFTFCWCKNCCTSWSGSFFHDFQGFSTIPGPRWLALGFLPLRVFSGQTGKNIQGKNSISPTFFCCHQQWKGTILPGKCRVQSYTKRKEPKFGADKWFFMGEAARVILKNTKTWHSIVGVDRNP